MESSITHGIDGEYIREWLILGPFLPDDLEKDFLAHVGGEKNVSPKEGDTVTTEDGRTLTWERYRTEEDSVSQSCWGIWKRNHLCLLHPAERQCGQWSNVSWE